MHTGIISNWGIAKTSNQITRLIAPDDVNPLAGFITWANLAEQTVLSFNASVPIQITKKWNAYFNASASHIDNQANYGEGAIVDVQSFHIQHIPATYIQLTLEPYS
ncbi:MAG: outer membrane beta-barrel protein [Saprospiraceae bacterium]